LLTLRRRRGSEHTFPALLWKRPEDLVRDSGVLAREDSRDDVVGFAFEELLGVGRT
jgi:hypothetical protein